MHKYMSWGQDELVILLLLLSFPAQSTKVS